MFMQVIQGEVADKAGLKQAFDTWVQDLSPGSIGWLGSTTGVTADNRFIALARFESEDAARRNSDRPEQHEWWLQTSRLMNGQPVFHESSQTMNFMGGGSDDAGFVQIIQGRVSDPQKAVELTDRTAEELANYRPEIIGGRMVMHSDSSHFTEAVYFTSENEARHGEHMTPPPDLKEPLEEEAALMSDLHYFDLPDPWLSSPK